MFDHYSFKKQKQKTLPPTLSQSSCASYGLIHVVGHKSCTLFQVLSDVFETNKRKALSKELEEEIFLAGKRPIKRDEGGGIEEIVYSLESKYFYFM